MQDDNLAYRGMRSSTVEATSERTTHTDFKYHFDIRSDVQAEDL